MGRTALNIAKEQAGNDGLFMTAEQKAFKDGYTKARKEDEYFFNVVLMGRLNALEKEANERIDEIPEEFDDLEDSENYNYYLGVLETIPNIKEFLGACTK